MQKKIFVIMIMLIVFTSTVFGYSDGFKYMLNNLNIDMQNANGYYINEEIYDKYNLLVYGSPLLKKENQRWKDTIEGNWTKNGGAWNGTGIRGEYWILRGKLFWQRSA